MLAPRHLITLGSADDWKRNGKDVQTTQIGLDLTPSIAVQPSFRGGPELEPDADWQESAQHIQRNDITNTLEPNTTNPHGLAPRELEDLNASIDWSRVANEDNLVRTDVVGDLAPNMKHTYSVYPRDFQEMDSEIGWQNVNRSDHLYGPDAASGLKPNAVHPNMMSTRDFASLGVDEDWKVPGPIAPDASTGVLEPNQVHPGTLLVRDFFEYGLFVF